MARLNTHRRILPALLAITLPAALLGACATPDKNPYYKVSTKYPSTQQTTTHSQGGAVVQQAGYPTQAPISYPQTTTQHSYPQSQSPYQQAPYQQTQTQSVYQSAPSEQPYVQTQDEQVLYVFDDQPQATQDAQTLQASTPVYADGSEYNGSYETQDAMVETGGQNGGQGGIYLQDAQPYDYAQNQPYVQDAQTTAQPVQISAPSAPAAAATVRSIGVETLNPSLGIATRDYLVQEEDTVYSLSLKTCSTVSAIQTLNNLDAAFTIRAGEVIRLPQGAC